MKPVLYLHNFRGFQNTFLQLERVNFFVGENSTGKTSILKIIKILSDPEFWFKNDSENFRKEYGYYSEITDFDFFEVGLISEESQKFILLKFVNSEGFAEFSEIRQLDSFIDIHININKSSIDYKFKKNDYSDRFKDSYLDFFKDWIQSGNLKNEKSHSSKNLKNLRVPLILQIQLTLAQHLDNKERKNSFKVPFLVEPMAWLAPIRTEPKRTYDDYELNFSPEGTHVPYLLKKQLKKSTKQTKKFERILNKFGEDSGMFEKITVTQFGKSTLAPFEINIVINNRPLRIINVGYGISQILPLIVEIVLRGNDSWFGLQQPEIHLHPRGQAAFGDLLYKSALNDKKGFVVETHSDYIIDRYRLKLSKNQDDQNEIFTSSQVVFFQRTRNGNDLSVIKILQDGSYGDNQPTEFQDFFIKEELSLLQI